MTEFKSKIEKLNEENKGLQENYDSYQKKMMNL
jgi:hypothetical protein